MRHQRRAAVWHTAARLLGRRSTARARPLGLQTQVGAMCMVQRAEATEEVPEVGWSEALWAAPAVLAAEATGLEVEVDKIDSSCRS